MKKELEEYIKISIDAFKTRAKVLLDSGEVPDDYDIGYDEGWCNALDGLKKYMDKLENS